MKPSLLSFAIYLLVAVGGSPVHAQRTHPQITSGDSIMRAKGPLTDARNDFMAAARATDISDSLRAVAYSRLAKTYSLEAGPASRDTGMLYRMRSLRVLEGMAPRPLAAISAAYVDLGIGYQHTQLDSAEILIRKAVDLYKTMPNPPTAGYLSAYNALGRLGQVMGNNALALSAGDYAVDLLDQLPGVTDRNRYDTYVYAGLRQRAFKSGDSGESYLKQGVAAAKRVGDPKMQARALLNLGAVYYTRDEPQKEQQQYLAALKLLDGVANTGTYRAAITNNLAYFYYRTDQTEAALKTNEEAIRLYRQYRPAQTFRAYSVRGMMLTAAGQYEEAVVAQDSAMRLMADPHLVALEGLAYPLLDSLNDATTALDMYGSRIEALILAKDANRLTNDLNALLDARDFMTARSTSEADESFWSTYEQDKIEAAVDFLLAEAESKPDHKWTILNTLDRTRGAGLLTSLRVRQERDDQRAQSLTDEIAKLERIAQPEASESQRLREAELELSYLRAAIRKDIPPTSPQNVAGLQALAEAFDGDILHYYVSPAASYLVHLRPDETLTVDTMVGQKTLRRLVTRFRTALVNSAYQTKSLEPEDQRRAKLMAFTQVADSLRTVLFPSVDPANFGQRVLIVPSGPLAYLPFGALTVKAGGDQFADLNYLQDGREISYAYSLRHLREIDRLPEVDYAYNFLGFAPAFTGAADVYALNLARSVAAADTGRAVAVLPALGPLVFNVKEVETIGELTGNARLFTGNEATKNNFQQQVGQGRILHLSTHGMVNAADPNLSFVAFANGENLYFNDLAGVPLSADLVVLSACETSLGKAAEGETTLSLGSAFANAGARSVLTSLWQVNDEATQQLMVAFYEALTAGQDKASALATAQAGLRDGERFAHPYYWSGMTLHGDMAAVDFPAKGGAPWWLYLLAGLSLVGLFWFGFKE